MSAHDFGSTHLLKGHRGVFVTFEGIEASGKSTLSRAVHLRLLEQEYPCLLTFEPGDTALGKVLRPLALADNLDARTEALLFAADRAHHVDTVIRPALEAGSIVLCDRFDASSIAYQGAWRGLGGDEIRTLSLFASDGLTPEMTFWCQLDPVVAAARKQGQHPDALDQAATASGVVLDASFAAQAAADPGRFTILDGTDSVANLAQQVFETITELYAWRSA